MSRLVLTNYKTGEVVRRVSLPKNRSVQWTTERGMIDITRWF